MKFIIDHTTKRHTGNICTYDKAECSLYMEGENTDGSSTMGDLYVTIDFDIASGQVIGISGYIGDIKNLKKISVGEFRRQDSAIRRIGDKKDYTPGVAYNSGILGKLSGILAQMQTASAEAARKFLTKTQQQQGGAP